MKRLSWMYVWLVCCLPMGAVAQERVESWQLLQEKEGVTIFMRERENSSVHEFKATVEVRTTPEAVEGLLRNVEVWVKWSKALRNPKILKHINEKEFISYQEINMPFFTKDRDLITHYIFSPLTEGFICRVINESDFLPLNTKFVRVPAYNALWVVKPKEAGVVTIIRQVYIEPGGKIPASIANADMRKTLHIWLTEMRKQLEFIPTPQ